MNQIDINENIWKYIQYIESDRYFFSNFLRIESKQILQHSDSGVLLTEKILKTIHILLLSSQLLLGHLRPVGCIFRKYFENVEVFFREFQINYLFYLYLRSKCTSEEWK